MPRSDAHLPALDGLRGIAILLVMLYHFIDQLHIGNAAALPAVERFGIVLSGAGWIGVDLFFVLSGFLITGILWRSREASGYFSSFFMRRFLRIFPLYYGILVGLLIILPLFVTPTAGVYRFLQDHQAWYWTYSTNFLIAGLGSFEGVAAGYFWSLAVEEQFYLVWPVLIWFLSRRAMVRICAGLFLLSAVSRVILLTADVPATAVYVLPFTRLEPLVVGAFLALMDGTPEARSSLGRWLGSAAGGSLVLLTGVFLYRGRFLFWDPLVVGCSITPLALVFGYCLFRTVQLPRATLTYRGLTHPVLLSFGKLSYAVYLFHPVAAALVKDHIINPLHHAAGNGSIALPLLTYLLAAGVLSWLAAFVSWHLMEKRFLELKKYFTAGKANNKAWHRPGTNTDINEEGRLIPTGT